jgi:hypothetical protein
MPRKTGSVLNVLSFVPGVSDCDGANGTRLCPQAKMENWSKTKFHSLLRSQENRVWKKTKSKRCCEVHVECDFGVFKERQKELIVE